MTSRIRWWPAVLIVISLVAGLLWVWLGPEAEGNRQGNVILTLLIGAFALLLFLFWFTFLSGMPMWIRGRGWLLLLLVVGALIGCFRFVGMSGDFVPRFEYRFRPAPEHKPSDLVSSRTIQGDFPQFHGPGRNGILPSVTLARDWASVPPRLLWRRDIGSGWSGFAVQGQRAVTIEQHGEEQHVVCYNLTGGEVLWRAVSSRSYAPYNSIISGDGPRATPTIADGRVYTFGPAGMLQALDLATGERLWSEDLTARFAAKDPDWGRSCSPLVEDGRVVVSAGGPNGHSLVAFSTTTGELLWGGGDDRSGYSSPMRATLAGVAQYLSLNHASVSGHDVQTGELLWSHPWSARNPNVTSPLALSGDRVLVSSGYGVGATLLTLRQDEQGTFQVEETWRSRHLKSKFSNLILHQGLVYGLDDGILVCLDLESGHRRWKGGRYGHGQLLLAGELLLVQTEYGELVLVEPDPEAHRELTRTRLFEGKLWNPPALFGNHLLVRTDQEAALFELPR